MIFWHLFHLCSPSCPMLLYFPSNLSIQVEVKVIPKSSQPLFNHFSNHCSLWNPLKSPCSICSCHRFCNHFSSEKHHVPFVSLHRHVQTWTMVWSSVHQFFPFQSTMFQCYQPFFSEITVCSICHHVFRNQNLRSQGFSNPNPCSRPSKASKVPHGSRPAAGPRRPSRPAEAACWARRCPACARGPEGCRSDLLEMEIAIWPTICRR